MSAGPRRAALGCAVLLCLAGGGLGLLCAGAVALPTAVVVLTAGRDDAARLDRHDAAPDGSFVRGHDVEMFVLDQGPRDGPVVVFVHGSGAWSGTWQPALDAVTAAGWRGVALDLPPFGFSERPATAAYDRGVQAERILRTVDGLGVDRFALVGHSFGGGPTVEAALRVPERLTHLVLIDVALGLGQPGASLGPFEWMPLRQAAVAATFTNPAFIPTGVRNFVHDPAVVTPEVVDRYRRPLGVRGSTQAIAAWLSELAAPAPARSLEPAAYRELTVPTLVLWGAEDTATPVDQAEALCALLPQCRLEVLPEVGHIPQIENPGRVHASLLRFLTSTVDTD
ncbi:MAG: pimeloyl-ACP methyl ester carboxylesterase [Myxococcota bacterium]